jgi:hypothetical protein
MEHAQRGGQVTRTSRARVINDSNEGLKDL